jgi:hypothetical protein
MRAPGPRFAPGRLRRPEPTVCDDAVDPRWDESNPTPVRWAEPAPTRQRFDPGVLALDQLGEVNEKGC